MNILNESVKHITFGFGVIKDVNESKIWVQFDDNIGTKAFLYPDSFERFLKAINPTVEKNILEKLHVKQEQLRLEMEQKEQERVTAELERLSLEKKRPAGKSKNKKNEN